MRGEAFGCGHSQFPARPGWQADLCLARHGGALDIRHRDGAVTAAIGLAQGGEGIGSLAGLRDDDDAGIGEGVDLAIDIFAGVFDIDGHAADVLNHDFACEGGMAAGAGGGEDDLMVVAEPLVDGAERSFIERAVANVMTERRGERHGLLINFAQHLVGELPLRGAGGHGVSRFLGNVQ